MFQLLHYVDLSFDFPQVVIVQFCLVHNFDCNLNEAKRYPKHSDRSVKIVKINLRFGDYVDS